MAKELHFSPIFTLQFRSYLVSVKLHVSNKRPGDTGAAGQGPRIEWQCISGLCRGELWAKLPSLQTTGVWFGDCGVEGAMVWSQETRI